MAVSACGLAQKEAPVGFISPQLLLNPKGFPLIMALLALHSLAGEEWLLKRGGWQAKPLTLILVALR